MNALLDWTHATTDIPERGLKRSRSATDAERAGLTEALDLLGCDSLDVSYGVGPVASGAWRVSGDLKADVIQACVVSLEPVPSRIAESFSVEFRRDAVGEHEQEANGDLEIFSLVDVEPLRDDLIDVGRIVYETFSAALDPYPRKSGAEFTWSDPREAESAARANPFAVLKKLKDEG